METIPPPRIQEAKKNVTEIIPTAEEVETLKALEKSKEHTARVEHDDGIQEISTLFIPGALNAKETIIVTVPWSDSPERDFAKFRAAALAVRTGANVILAGFPGMDKETEGTISREQADDLNSETPSFISTSEAVNEAITSLLDTELEGEDVYCKDMSFTLLGYSMGASTAAGMLATLDEKYSLKNVFIAESPDIGIPQDKTALGKKFLMDGLKYAGGYKGMNKTRYSAETVKTYDLGGDMLADATLIPKMFTPRKAGGKRDVLYNGPANAMAQGTILPDIKVSLKSGRLENTNFYIFNGSASKVSPVEQGQWLKEELDERSLDLGDIRAFVSQPDQNLPKKAGKHGHEVHSMQEAIGLYVNYMGHMHDESEKAA